MWKGGGGEECTGLASSWVMAANSTNFCFEYRVVSFGLVGAKVLGE